ncbi:MAG: type I-E CRISPR-associated protein Cas6/Cse3/CasE [Methylobacter sp.]|nr:type I-E CRISPR-associated protein Cas6/Cse3/CasE [Methylobacter sp.]MDP2428406.1 type I-E CRISPR-associated protein Cas6/Cse3/CasE [Methylobacter sp.]MDP3055192.1 type I-E CRISPR-associated protein Cas6/Cse3/CasE [Methylobacter sp.]MDP3362366.1 type I-E CRISPR-associated protein Cas6/Cse3/CasE [Methylobacter sp.]MDZ4217485.1 type I-E CRISPR-associated protein Cas6/Cse3/CasE [Methylobacter sp.]
MQNTEHTISEIRFLAGSVGDAYQAHQTAWSVVGQSPTQSRHFHHDYMPLPFNRGAFITVRALSNYLPGSARVIQTHHEVGSTLEFTLGAAASVIRRDKKEFPCVTRDELLQWINTRCAANGFDVQPESLNVDSEASLIAKPGKPRFFLNRAHFSGALKVTDSDLFAQALVNGIGRHKGLGFGMLKIINQ